MLEHYDVFISYSHVNGDFVRGSLLPELEAAGLSVCIDFRDFEIGVPSVVNMSRAIERSQHTIAVLSQAWVSGEWTYFEALLGTTADPVGRTRRILPLLLESCKPPSPIAMLTHADLRDPGKRAAEIGRLISSLVGSPARLVSVGSIDSSLGESRLAAQSSALTYLLAAQYPWGEWSDRRTGLESVVAERRISRGPEGPKPNVARTLFALEALKVVDGSEAEQCRQRAISWVLANVRDGWFREWSAHQTRDSEEALPSLYLRRDTRHTAQAATISAKWRLTPEALEPLVLAVAESRLDSGLWPETPGDDDPRILATVFAVEALAIALSDDLPPPIDRLVGTLNARRVWDSFRLGLAALHREVDLGAGLLGETTAKATPYLTGIGLFRLAAHSRSQPEIRTLTTKMIAGLETSLSSDGWRDLSLPQSRQEETRIRTTLRVCAGLAVARNTGLPVDEQIWTRSLELAIQIGMAPELGDLDSPDFACLVLALGSGYDRPKPTAELIVASREINGRLRRPWLLMFKAYKERLSDGVAQGVPGYRELEAELAMKVQLLQAS